MNKQQYVAGFLFDTNKDYVAFVEKKKFPKGKDWSKHPLNAIGGKVELGEDPHTAMVREFKEETGVEIPVWEQFLLLESDTWIVRFYRAFDNAVFNCGTQESEVIWIRHSAWQSDMMPNLKWILPMALDSDTVGEAGVAANVFNCSRVYSR